MANNEDIRFGPGPLKGLRVLVAEDDAWVAERLSVMLEEEGARLIGPAASVTAARKQLDKGVDFLLVDLDLADGFADELVEDARRRNIPYAIITGYQAAPTNAYDGAEAVILKPIDRRLLIEMLTQFA